MEEIEKDVRVTLAAFGRLEHGRQRQGSAQRTEEGGKAVDTGLEEVGARVRVDGRETLIPTYIQSVAFAYKSSKPQYFILSSSRRV